MNEYTIGGQERGAGRHSLFSLIALIAVIAIAAVAGLGIAFWALGLLFHLAGWIARVALLAAVAALVWRRVTRGSWRTRL